MVKRLTSRVKKIWAEVALLSVEMLAILAVFFGSMYAFIVMTRRVFLLGNDEMDHKVFDVVKPYINDTNTAIMNFVTFLVSTSS